MPIPRVYDPQARKIAEELRRIAGLMDDLARVEESARSFRQLQTIASRLERIGDALQKGVGARRVTAAQIRSIAANFEAVGAALRKSL